MAKSAIAGKGGIEGPYTDVGPALTSAASFGGRLPGSEGGHLGVDSFHPYSVGSSGAVQALVGHTGLVPAKMLHNFSYLEQCDDKPQPDVSLGQYYGNFGRVSANAKERAGLARWKWEDYSVAKFDAYGCGPPDGSCNVVPTAGGPACQCGYYENPVVMELQPKGSGYIATIDVVSPGKATHVSELIGFGWIYSPNGETWEPEVHMVAIPGGSRTPLGLVPAPEAVDGDDGSAGGDATIVNGSKGARLAVVYSSTSDHKPLKCCPPHGQTFPLYGAILEAL